jgi:hypothetical protein
MRAMLEALHLSLDRFALLAMTDRFVAKSGYFLDLPFAGGGGEAPAGP